MKNKNVFENLRMLGETIKSFKSSIIIFTFIAFLFPNSANNYSYALPSGADIQNGDVQIEQADSNTLNITASNQAIINWNSFNIAQNETVNFIQPLNSSTILNRVIGGGMSDISGALNANGTVILINPAGINFSSSANVNVGGLIASSLNITNENFLASNYVFEHIQEMRTGTVINSGNITATRPGAVVAMLGDVVKNEGVIVADVSTVVLASGNKMVMKFDDSGMIQFDVTEGVKADVQDNPSSQFANAVSNTGTIKADGGHVLLNAEQVSRLFQKLVNQEGYIEANSVENVGGVIVLKGSSGTVRNAGDLHAEGKLEGTSGGMVKVLGEDVQLEHSLINTSGVNGGGTILVGGNFQGKGLEPNATHTYVSNDSVLKADSIISGDGGKVIIWADYSTLYYGSVSAQGGSESGNGGFAEVSGKDYLDYDGFTDLRASNGVTGTLLLDPRNLTISAGATTGGAFGGGDPNTFTPTADSSVLNDGDLETALGTANVIVTTGVTGVQAGDITISAVITAPANANSLTLQAADDIIINENIDMSASSGNLTLRADSDSSGVGNISRGAGDTILMGTGDLLLQAGNGVGSSATPILTTSLTDVAASTGTGGIFISNSTSGNINITTVGSITGLSTTTGAASTGGNISVVNLFAGGTITVSGAITGGANAAGSTGNIILTTTGAGAANIVVNANITSGAASIVDSAAGNAIVSGNITLTAGGSGAISGTGALTTGTADISGAAAAGADTATSGNIVLSATGGSIGLSNAAALQTGAATRSGAGAGTDTATVGNITQSAGGEINNGTASTKMAITAGVASGALTNNQGTLATTTTTGSGNAFLNVTGTTRLAASTISNNFDITSSGPITQTGTLTITGTSSFTAGANAITLTTAANNFTGAVSLNNSGANNVAITDVNAIVLGTSAVGSGTLTVTAVGITQTGAVTQAAAAGTASFAGGAGVVTLTNAGNDFTGSVGVTNSGANAVSVTDVNALVIGTVTVGTGTLTFNASGAITQTGIITQTAAAGAVTVNAGANPITLTNVSNNFIGAVSLNNSGANDVAIRDVNAIILGTSAVGSGALTVTAVGITQTGAIVQEAAAGTATFNGGAAVITLTNAGNDFTGSVSLINSGANNVSITDVNAIALGTITMTTGTLSVVSTGAITQTGSITNTGTATFAAGAANNITLTNAANDFTNISITTGNDVSITDVNGINFAATTVSGNLVVTANGAITDSAVMVITGNATITAGAANSITLNTATNNFSTISIVSGLNVTLVDTNGIDLGASTISGTFSLTAAGAVTDSGTLAVTGVTTIVAGAANNVTLDIAANNFSTVAVTSGNNVTLVDTNAIILGTSTISGTYNVTAGGVISQSGVLTVTGISTFAAGAGNNITLNTSANNFSTVIVTSGLNVAFLDANAIILGASTVSGTLAVTTTGAITDSGTLLVTGTATFSAGAANSITLDEAANDFSTVAITSGLNVTVNDVNSLILGTAVVSGTYNITTSGAITQSGTQTVTGVATFTAGAANDITLATAANNFATVAIVSGNNASIRDSGAIIFGTSTLATSFTVTAGGAITQTGVITSPTITAKTLLDAGAAITLNIAAGNEATTVNLQARNTADTANAAGAIAYRDATGFDISGVNTTSTLALTSAGAITDSGTLTVGGVTTIVAGAANNVTLDVITNNFSTVAVTSGNNVTLVDANAIILGTSTISGTYNVTAGGAITQSGVLTVTGTSTFDSGAANNITLNTSSNNFSTIVVTAGNNAAFLDANAIILGASTVSGTLAVTTTGAITDSGTLLVTGTATFSAGAANSITLDEAANDFSTVAITTGLNVSINDVNAINFGASTISGTFTVTANGTITDSATIVVTGATTLTAGAANDITLDVTTNNFGTVSVVSANNVTLRDTNAIVIGTSTAATSFTVISGSSTITQTGAITTPTLNAKTLANAGAAITLTNAGNEVTTINLQARNAADTANAAGAISYTDATGFDVDTINTTSTLALTAGEAITDTGTLTVGGVTTIVAGAANDVVLNSIANNFATVAVTSGNNVTLVDANAIILGVSTISGNLNVTASGAITQSGAVAVTGTSSFIAGSNAITLTTATNNFTGAISISNGGANNISITDTNAIVLGTVSVGSGTLTVTAVGITQTGVITQAAGAGTASFVGGAGVITLTNAANEFTGTVTLSNSGVNNVSITDVNSLTLGASATGLGNLTVNAGGTLTVSGAVSTAANAAGSSGSISMTTSSGNIVVNAGITTGTATLADSAAVETPTSGSITLISAGNISGTGAITTGTSAITGAAAAGADIATSGSISLTASGGGIGLSNAAALVVGTASRTGAVTDTAVAGSITLSSTGEINNNTASTAMTVTIGAASGATTNTQGALSASTTGASGNIFVRSAAAFRINDLSTAAGSAQTVNVSTTGAVALTLNDVARTITGDAVTFGTGTGLLTITNTVNPIDVAAGSLTLTSDTLSVSGGANSIRGTGGTLLIQPSTTTTTIGIAGAAGTLQVTSGIVTAIQDGFSSITIGRSNGTGAITINAVSFKDNVTIQSPVAGGTITVNGALTTGSGSSAGTITLRAGSGVTITNVAVRTEGQAIDINGDVDGNGTGTITVSGASSRIDTTNLGASAAGADITLKGATFTSTGPAASITAGTSGAVNFFNSLASASIGVGGGAGTYNITDAELTTVGSAGTIRFGEAGVQSGTVTIQTVTSPVSSAVIEANSNVGTGSVALDDAGVATALATGGTGNVIIRAGSGGVTATQATGVRAEISTTGTISITAAGPVGTSTNRVQFVAGQAGVGITTTGATGNVFLGGLGSLTLAASSISGTLDILTSGAIAQSGSLAVTGTTTMTSGAGTDITLTNSGNSFGGLLTLTADDISVSAGSGMTLGAITSTASITLSATGSILDGNAGANNLTAVANSSLTAGGVVGTEADPLEVTITGATLTISAASVIGLVSGDIDGTVTPSNTLIVNPSTPGRIIFNGQVVNVIPPEPPVIYGSSDLFDLYNSIDQINEFVEEEAYLYQYGIKSDPFFKKKLWSIKSRPVLPKSLPDGVPRLA